MWKGLEGAYVCQVLGSKTPSSILEFSLGSNLITEKALREKYGIENVTSPLEL